MKGKVHIRLLHGAGRTIIGRAYQDVKVGDRVTFTSGHYSGSEGLVTARQPTRWERWQYTQGNVKRPS